MQLLSPDCSRIVQGRNGSPKRYATEKAVRAVMHRQQSMTGRAPYLPAIRCLQAMLTFKDVRDKLWRGLFG